MKRIVVKRAGEPAKIVEADFKYRGECRGFVNRDGDATIQYVEIEQEKAEQEHRLCMMVDEDGLCKELPLAFFAEFRGNPFFPVQAIVGDVVFCRFKWENPWEKEIWDFELEDMTEADFVVIEQMLSKEKQIMLWKEYEQLHGR